MSFTPNHLSQCDPRWAGEQLGFDNTVTIRTDGCALTCLSMLVNGYGFNETPDTLNQKLKVMGPGVGFIGGMIVWGSLTRAFPGIVYQNIVLWDSPPAALDLIDASLNSGQPVVVEIDESPAPGVQNHWVVLYAKQGNDYLMLDPWPYPPDNQATTLISRYGFGREPQDFIVAAVWYMAQGSATPSTPPSGPGFYVQVPVSLITGLNLRSAASTDGNLITRESAGSWLKVLELSEVAQAKIGVQDQWLNVQDPQGNVGYVAAWYLQSSSQPAPAPTPQPMPSPAPQPPSSSALTVIVLPSVGEGGLHLRDQPSTAGNLITSEATGTLLNVLEPTGSALAKIGVLDQWLNVSDGSEKTGYVAAWYVALNPSIQPTPTQQPVPLPQTPAGTTPAVLTVIVSSQASAGLNLRDQPNVNANLLKVLMPGTGLTVLEPAETAKVKVGVNGQWLNVREPGGQTGYVAAWYVQF